MASKRVAVVDIDGVLNPFKVAVLTTKDIAPEQWNPETLQLFGVELDMNRECIRRLNKLTDMTGAEIVISSSWRLGDQEWWDNLKKALIIYGIRGNIIDRTPLKSSRGEEIAAWVAEHPEVENYVALDDDLDMVPVWENTVHVDNKVGLQDNNIEKAISILNAKKKKNNRGVISLFSPFRDVIRHLYSLV